MGALTITLPQTLMDRMDVIARSDGLPSEMLDAAMDIMEPELRKRLHMSIKNHGLSGDLEKSVKRSKPRFTAKGVWRASIYFDGYDKNGIPNDRKAMSMEWGTSKQVAEPFIRPTKESKNSEAVGAMEKVFHKVVGG